MFRVKKAGRSLLVMLGAALVLGPLFGLLFGYFYGQYAKHIIIASGIYLTIFIFNALFFLFILFLKIKSWPKNKRLGAEIGGFFLSTLLGFVSAISIFGRIYHFSAFKGKTLLINLGLLLVLYMMMAGLIYSYKFHRELRDKELASAKLKALAAEADLKALQAQLNPHFLFNTLNSINALSNRNPHLARKMITRLSDLLRMALENRENMFVPLRRELDFLHLYLDIEKVRFGRKLDFRESVDPSLREELFPAMVLQPLLENALKHGLAGLRHGGPIWLELKREQDVLRGRLSNSVSGTPFRSLRPGQSGSGLSNIRQRLALLFGSEHFFQAGCTVRGTYEVNFSFPLARGRNRGT